MATAITIGDDDEGISNEEFLSTTTSSDNPDEQNRRNSDISSITNFTINKTSDEFRLNSITGSSSSTMNIPISSLSLYAVSSKQSLIKKNATNRKSKHTVRNFFRKIFGSTSINQGSTSIDSVNIDYVQRTAYPAMAPLPITQGPIRLFVLRHGERLDQYYSSQWLRQAFDKDGNFCRFSPILP